MSDQTWSVYLAGEIHSDWRAEIEHASARAELPVRFTGPVTDHGASDACGVSILGDEPDPFWADHKGAGVNAIRTSTMIQRADVVIARFGERYRQWNTAFDAGQAVALGKPLIVMHDPGLTHALKEVDAAARAVCRTPEQAAAILRYVIRGELG